MELVANRITKRDTFTLRIAEDSNYKTYWGLLISMYLKISGVKIVQVNKKSKVSQKLNFIGQVKKTKETGAGERAAL